MRDYNAYTTPSGIFVGIGVYEIFGALILLIAIKMKATALWRVSTLALINLLLAALVDMLILDYISSPFNVDVKEYLGTLYFAAYVLNFTSTVLITSLFVMRINVFYGATSRFSKSMTALAVFMILVKSVGDGMGCYNIYNYISNKYNSPIDDPVYHIIPFILGGSSLLEGIFSAIGSVSFIYYLTDFSNDNSWNSVRTKVFQTEGVRLILIVCVHSVIMYLGIWVAFDDNYVSHVGFFLPILVYGLELHTFLDLSYNSAAKIIEEVHNSSSKEKSRRANQSTINSPKNMEASTFKYTPPNSSSNAYQYNPPTGGSGYKLKKPHPYEFEYNN